MTQTLAVGLPKSVESPIDPDSGVVSLTPLCPSADGNDLGAQEEWLWRMPSVCLLDTVALL